MAHDSTILAEAAEWAVRTAEPDFEEWAAFTDWLQQSPAHNAAYDHVVMEAEAGSDVLRAAPANDADDTGALASGGQHNYRWIGAGLAACVALLCALWLWQPGAGERLYQTAPGETQLVELADGSSILLGGDSVLALENDKTRYARLDQGRALFRIEHDDRAPFHLDVGASELVDAGTIFDVAIRSAEIRVGVSEGAVIYNPEQQNRLVNPGQFLTIARADGSYRIGQLPADQVGEWGDGRLTFRDASLEDVATEISAATGLDYRVSPGSGNRPVSGSVLLDPLEEDPAMLGELLGIEVSSEGSSWILQAE